MIITGKRTQKPPPDKNVYAIHAHALVTQGADLSQYLSAFATEASKPAPVENISCIHQSQLPKTPQFVKDLDTHMFSMQFNKAMIKEWTSLRKKGCIKKTNKTKATADAEVLLLIWVFTYKIGEDGYLLSFKARLVIWGNLEDPLENTYAATFAIRNFWALISIANYFNLELKQYNIPTAFLNAKLNRKLYALVPDGVQDFEGVKLLEVLLALYGLKELPKLWFDTLKHMLTNLGLKQVSGFPCLYTNKWLIFFIYVDDIVMACHNANSLLHRKFEQQLVDFYNLKPMRDLAWFLGIWIIRNWFARKTWLIQNAFIDKVCNWFNIDLAGKKPDVPITENWIKPSNEEPDKERTKIYQQFVGSLAYIAVWGRSDVAWAHVIFACHLTNLGQSHISKICQC